MEKRPVVSINFFTFWAILGLMALFAVSLLPWRFQVNDDEVMMWLVSGAYTGKPEPFAVFLHPILSWAFSNLYTLIPEVPWYPVTWFLILYFSFLVLIRLLTGEVFHGYRTVFALFIFAFYSHFLFFLQFSVVSAFAITAGLTYRLSYRKKDQVGVFFLKEDALILLGFLIRPEVLLLFVGGTLVLLVFFFRKRKFWKRILPVGFIYFIGMLVFWAWIHFFDLQNFIALDKQRSQVFDHPLLQLKKEDFIKSDPELYYFSIGLVDFTANPNLVSELPHWKMLLDQRRFALYQPGELLRAMTIFIKHEQFLIGLAGCFVVFSLFVCFRRALLILCILLAGVIAVVPFFLLNIQVWTLVLLFFLMMVLIADSFKMNPVNFRNLIASILILAIGFHYYSFTQGFENLKTNQKLISLIDSVKEKGEVYLTPFHLNYHGLIFEKRLPFKIMGWPTLLEYLVYKKNKAENYYIIDLTDYHNNIGYFSNDYEQVLIDCSYVILKTKIH